MNSGTLIVLLQAIFPGSCDYAQEDIAWDRLRGMKKPALFTLLVLAVLVFLYVARAKRAAEAEAELWSEALDPVF